MPRSRMPAGECLRVLGLTPEASWDDIRQAYKDLVAAATPDSVKKAQAAQTAAVSGTVPAYLTAQISNYQAALQRLTGGQS